MRHLELHNIISQIWAGGELFSRLVKNWGERRRRTEAGARSRSFVFCALDSRQLSFIQPAVPRQLSLVAYKTPLTPAKKRTPHSRHFRFDSPPKCEAPSLYRPRKASPPLGMGLADVTSGRAASERIENAKNPQGCGVRLRNRWGQAPVERLLYLTRTHTS